RLVHAPRRLPDLRLRLRARGRLLFTFHLGPELRRGRQPRHDRGPVASVALSSSPVEPDLADRAYSGANPELRARPPFQVDLPGDRSLVRSAREGVLNTM